MSGITRRQTLAAAAGTLALPGIARAQSQQQLAIATGTTGGVYYPLGGALANYLSRGIPGMSATVEVTGGSVANLQLLGANRVGMVLTQVDAAVDAVRGNDRFREIANGNAGTTGILYQSSVIPRVRWRFRHCLGIGNGRGPTIRDGGTTCLGNQGFSHGHEIGNVIDRP